MTRYLDEAFEVHDAVKKTGKIFQVGSQGCSAVGWHKAAEMIQAGKIGKLVWAQGYYCRNNPKGEWNYSIEKEATPQNMDWDDVAGPGQGQACPFSADRFFRWRKYYPYCARLAGRPGAAPPASRSCSQPATRSFPTRVVSIGTKNVHTDKGRPARRSAMCPNTCN